MGETPSPPMMRMRDRLRLPRVGGGGRGGVKEWPNRQSASETARFPSYFTKQPLLTAVVLSRNKLYVQVVRFFSWNLQMFQIYVHGIFFVSSTNKLFSPLCDLTL